MEQNEQTPHYNTIIEIPSKCLPNVTKIHFRQEIIKR